LNRRFLNSDVNLIRRLRKNDNQAFEFIFNKFKEKLYYFILGYLHSPAESEEILQNVFVSLWENRNSLKEECPLDSFLYKVTVNYIYNHFKHQAVRQKYLNHMATAKESIEDYQSEQSILLNDLQGMVDKIVDRMPLKQQVIYRLSRRDGLSHNEIASRLGLSVRSVENQIYRALKYIKEKLREESLLTE